MSEQPSQTLDTGPRPRRRRSAASWAALTAGGVFAVVVILAVTWGAINWVGKVTEQRELRLAPVDNKISVRTSSGDVRISRGDTDQVVLTERITHTFSTPNVEAVTTGDGLEIRDNCRWWASTCRVDFTLAVPPGQAIVVHTSAGDITASGLSGPLDLDTSAGDVHGDGLTSSRVTARSSAGDISLVFDQPPDEVQVDTSAGDVDVRVPRSGGPYRVDVKTSAGDERVGVPRDPGAARHIRVHTSAGDAVVEPT